MLGGVYRVSSPCGTFSILMTSAPMSASINVQVGPAMTCVRSITFIPAKGPMASHLNLVGSSLFLNAKYADDKRK